ncbi:MAG: hypothetical protein JXR64_13505 [Spirochaetales bacterium]|nr:hypothetical protein [Spirochaetales bacterium]
MRKIVVIIGLVLMLVNCASQPDIQKETIVLPDELYSQDTIKGDIICWENYKIPQLNRTRTIRIYLPPGYSDSNQSYPVMYMQDGQNVYNDNFSVNGGWKVNDTIDSIVSAGLHRGIIVVAIDNSAYRVQEYVPYKFETAHMSSQQSQADAMSDFIVETLKPDIDNNFRTLTNIENTMISGSSFGSFLTIYTVLRHPGVFGKVGAFSTALSSWNVAKEFEEYILSSEDQNKTDWFFYVGKDESSADSQLAFDAISKLSPNRIVHYIDPKGGHDEASWAASYRSALPWMLNISNEIEPIWDGIRRDKGFYNSRGEFILGKPELKGNSVKEGEITFIYSGEGKNVVLAGDFSGWDATRNEFIMKKVDDHFEITIPMKAGSYKYKYVIDDRWVSPSLILENMKPEPTDLVDDGFGGFNAVLVLE